MMCWTDSKAGNSRSVLRPAGGPITKPTEVCLSLVACVSNERTLEANLLASPCLRTGSPHEVILVKNCQSAADGLSLGIQRAEHRWLVALHQDVYLPAGWDRRLLEQLEIATRQFGSIGVAGVYTVGPLRRGEAESDGEHNPGHGDGNRVPSLPRYAVDRSGEVGHHESAPNEESIGFLIPQGPSTRIWRLL